MAEREKSFLEKLRDALNKNQGNVKTRNARDWFQRRARALKSELRNKFTQVDTADEFYAKSKKTNKRNIGPGSIFAYFYDPKYKKELKYYDRFPLALLVGPAPGGYYRINLHYLHPRIRAILLDRLMTYAIGTKETLRLKISYRLLKSTSRLKAFRPCFKHYLKKHIRSRMV